MYIIVIIVLMIVLYIFISVHSQTHVHMFVCVFINEATQPVNCVTLVLLYCCQNYDILGAVNKRHCYPQVVMIFMI